MPLSTVKFQPGVNAEITQAQGVAQITSSQLIRFKMAGGEVLPEKLGGWAKFYPLSLGSPVRDLHAWEGINADAHLAAGCEQSLDVITNGIGIDVTPRTITTNPAVSFSTVNGNSTVTIDDSGLTTSPYDSIYILTPVSVGGLVLRGAYQIVATIDADSYTIDAGQDATATVTAGGAVPVFGTAINTPAVTVTLDNHGYSVGETFAVPTPTTVGGITIAGAYIVQDVTDADHFIINNAQAASSTATGAMNGGNARIVYYIGIGPSLPYAGYGTGTYGAGAYGLGIVPTPSTGTPITTANWTLDNWGEILLACPANGAIYQYSTDSGLAVATRIIQAPEINGGIFIAQPAQILVAWASSQGGVQDPLSVNWSDAGDFENWTVTSQTQAGGFRFPTGSRIVGGIAGPNFGIIWTDVEVWAMDYIEPPLIFGFNSLANNCGLISRHAMATLNTTVYWMGNEQFFALSGESVQTIPCPVWDFIFQDLDTAHADKIYAGSNTLFGEITFYFPSLSGGTGEVDSYVKFNTQANTWDFGRLARSAWIDQSPVGPPVGGAPTGFLYQHEISPDADGQPMVSSFSTGYFTVADGENLTFVDWVLPDFRFGYYGGQSAGIVQLSLMFGDYPTSTPKLKGPYSVSNTTPFVNTRLRARFVGLTIGSNDLGSFWRLGGLKIRSAPDGKR